MTMTNGTVATIGQPAALAIRPGQEMWTDKQKAALSVLGIKNATNADLAVFMHYCQKTGLDPFSRQIYMICRREKQGDQWVDKQTIQVGIDGFRVIRDRLAARAGVEVEYEDTIWYDSAGGEHTFWLSDEAPAGCRVVVLKNGKRYPGVLRTASYMAVNKNGDPVSQWKTQPDHMIEKCAEAFALRRAFPNDLGGIYLEDELPAAPQEMAPQYQRVTAAEVIGQTGWAEDTPDTPPAVEPTPPAREAATPAQPAAGGAEQPTSGQLSSINRRLGELGVDDPEERLGFLSSIAGRPVDALADLTRAEAGNAAATLKAATSRDDLVKLTTAGDKPGSDG